MDATNTRVWIRQLCDVSEQAGLLRGPSENVTNLKDFSLRAVPTSQAANIKQQKLTV